jgi:flagellar FliJ protein
METRLLSLLIERALSVRDDAVKLSVRAAQERDAAASTLRTLTEYRDESLQRGPVRAGHVCNTDQLSIAGQFDARLVTAIRQQSGQHALKEQAAQQRQGDVAQAQRRLKAFETVAQRQAQRAQLKEARREQRAMDDFASDLGARRRNQDKPK